MIREQCIGHQLECVVQSGFLHLFYICVDYYSTVRNSKQSLTATSPIIIHCKVSCEKIRAASSSVYVFMSGDSPSGWQLKLKKEIKCPKVEDYLPWLNKEGLTARPLAYESWPSCTFA
jgi:hypothetical protein